MEQNAENTEPQSQLNCSNQIENASKKRKNSEPTTSSQANDILTNNTFGDNFDNVISDNSNSNAAASLNFDNDTLNEDSFNLENSNFNDDTHLDAVNNIFGDKGDDVSWYITKTQQNKFRVHGYKLASMGYFYTIDKPKLSEVERAVKIYWKCEKTSTFHSCNGRAISYGLKPPLTITQQHNHEPAQEDDIKRRTNNVATCVIINK